jgi:hypothetical protein
MEKTVDVREVKTFETRSGEYATFRPEIGRRAQEAPGKRARIEYHEQERDGFQNVYLDAVEPLEARIRRGG